MINQKSKQLKKGNSEKERAVKDIYEKEKSENGQF